MSSTIPFSFSRQTLFLGKGKNKLPIDSKNGLFQPIVELLDYHSPKNIRIYSNLSSKVYLNIVRALFHSKVDKFALSIIKTKIGGPWENYLYPLSKSFGQDLKSISKKKYRSIECRNFQINRKLSSYPYKLSLNLISNGENLATLYSSLENIFSQNLSKVVVRVIGPDFLTTIPELKSKYPTIEWLSDKTIYSSDTRFPISKKKNLALEKSDSEFIAIFHERIRFGTGWVDRLLNEIRCFDIYTCTLRNLAGARYLDKFGIRFSSYPCLRKNHYYLSYKEDNSDQLVDGGLFVISHRALGKIRFDESLHWGEMEDIDFVLKLKLAGCLISFDALNFAQSTTSVHFSLKDSSLFLKVYKTWLRRWGWNLPFEYLRKQFS